MNPSSKEWLLNELNTKLESLGHGISDQGTRMVIGGVVKMVNQLSEEEAVKVESKIHDANTASRKTAQKYDWTPVYVSPSDFGPFIREVRPDIKDFEVEGLSSAWTD